MVKWYVEKKLFASTLDNASANDVAVNDIIADLRDVDASLVCDGIFFSCEMCMSYTQFGC